MNNHSNKNADKVKIIRFIFLLAASIWTIWTSETIIQNNNSIEITQWFIGLVYMGLWAAFIRFQKRLTQKELSNKQLADSEKKSLCSNCLHLDSHPDRKHTDTESVLSPVSRLTERQRDRVTLKIWAGKESRLTIYLS